MIKAILFDVGDTLVVAAAPGTPVDALVARPIGQPVRDLMALRSAGIRLGAVTNVQVIGEAEVRALLAPIGLDDLLEVVVTSTAVGAEKPHPRGILHALDSLGVAPNDALFVGDEDADAGAAAAAGVAFARVDAATTAADAVRAALTLSDGAFAAAAALVGPLDSVVGPRPSSTTTGSPSRAARSAGWRPSASTWWRSRARSPRRSLRRRRSPCSPATTASWLAASRLARRR